MKERVQLGFSMIELLVVVVIMSIILATAIPELRGVSNTINFDAIQRQAISSLFFARAEAIKQGGNITVCPSSDGATCLASISNWNNGWIIFQDIDGNGSFDGPVDQLVKVISLAGIANLTWEGSRNITFRGDGAVFDGSQGNLRICELSGGTQTIRGVAVNLNGRVIENNSVTCP